MEIIPIFTQQTTSDPVLLAVHGAIAVSGILIALRLVSWIRHRLRTLPTHILSVAPPALSLGALATLASAPPALAARARTDLNPGSAQTSPALYERVPPPRSLVRAGVITPARRVTASVHPAIHRSSADRPSSSLFPRAATSRVSGEKALQPWERGAIDLRRAEMQRHPSRARTETQSHYAVMPGDTLWDIAARVLDTDDQRAIARYWPKIHRENRAIIGRDPNLIRPGQVLTLPPREQV